MSRCVFWWLAIVTMASWAPGKASAEEPSKEARELARQAIELSKQAKGDAGVLADAIALFKRAFELDPRPHYQCSIGIAYQEAGELALAHNYLARCILRSSEPARKAELIEYHVALENELRRQGFVPVDLASKPAGARIRVDSMGWNEDFVAPTQLWLPRAQHQLSVSHPGFERESVSIVVKGKAKSRTVELRTKRDALPKVDAAVESSPMNPTAAMARGDTLELAPTKAAKPSRTKVWAAYGGALAAGVGSALFFSEALAARERIVDESPRGAAYDSLSSDVRRNEVFSYSLGGLSLAAAALGTYWLIEEPESGKGVSVAPSLGGHGIVFSWSSAP